MSSVPAKKNAAYEDYVALLNQTNTMLVRVNPTLAVGDVKVSKDNGAPENIITLPVVGADQRLVKLNLAASEMNADNVTIIFSDVAGNEWCDLVVNIKTSASQIDDLAASLATIAGYLDTEVASILAAINSTGVVLTVAERNAIADALLDRADAIEVGLTVRNTLRLKAAEAAGKLSGAGTGQVVVRNAVADTKNRITATVDGNGNCSAVVLDLT